MKLFRNKRTIAVFLATALTFTAAAPLLTLPAQAALKQIPVKFMNGQTAAEVVEGNDTPVVVNLPNGYLEAEPPFLVYEQNGQPIQDSGKGMISYKPKSLQEQYGRFVANQGSGGTDLSSYTIKGQFFALTAEGEAIERWKPLYEDNPDGEKELIDPAGSGVAPVISVLDKGITIDSRINITCTTGETAMIPPTFVVSGDATGAFSGYNDVIATKDTEGSKKVIKLRMGVVGQTAKLELKLYPQQGHSVVTDWKEVSGNWKPVLDPKGSDLIMEGTTYNIDFVMPTSNDLLLKVVTPKHLTTEIAGNVGGKDTSQNYVKLSGDDDFEWILNDFMLLTEAGAYGANVKIDWKWVPVPANAAYDNVVDIKTGKNPVVARVNQQEDDVHGKLVATISYAGKYETATNTAEVDIVIKGMGKPPFVRLGKKFIGTKPAEDIATGAAADNIANLPTRMDVYDGSVVGFETVVSPYRSTFMVNMGEKNAASDYMIINSTDPEAVKLVVGGNNTAYKFGEKINNPTPQGQGEISVILTAEKGARNTVLSFDFYAKDKNGKTERYDGFSSPNITIEDSTPSSDATLKALTMKSSKLPADYSLDFGFVSTKNIYDVTVPYAAETIDVSSAVNEMNATSTISVKGSTEPPEGTDKTLKDVKLEEGKTKKIEVIVIAQDRINSQTYILNVTRSHPDKDSSLKSLKIFSDASTSAPDLLKGFLPAKLSYDIEVPYGVKKVRVDAEATSRWVTDISILPKPTRDMFFSRTEWINLGHVDDPESNLKNPTEIETTVIAEDGNSKTTYAVGVKRLDPSENNMLSMMELKDKLGNPLPYNENKVFANITRDYYINIPFSTEEVRLVVKPEHEYAEKVTLAYGGKTPIEKKYDQKNKVPIEYRGLKIPVVEYPETFVFSVFATAESGRPKTAADAIEPYYMYTIEFTRNPADSDTRLENLLLTDQDNKTVEEFTFNKETAEYEFEVPYVTSAVNVTPTAQSKLSSVTVNTQLITENRKFLTVPLTAGKKSVITVEVTAENGDRKAYIINVTRGMPSTEARLDALSVPEGTNFAPRFIPSTEAYTVTLPEGIKEYTVLATTVDPNATIAINKKAAVSGVAFGPIKSVDEKSTVTITVTAQDGKTKKVYTIAITDDNFVIKGDNSDLANLRVENGEMSPRFRPAIEDYEVYLKDETDWITILPKPIDRNSTIEVMAGSKKLGDYYGNYSTAVIDDTMDITITVKAPSPTAKPRVYNVTVMRKNEEKQGNLKPITEEMVNYEQESPIIVDVSKYHIVAAGVINKMKDYPDKSIIFKGNDCSWEMRGKDLKKLVPNTDKFDFAMSFSTPDEDFIWDIMDEESRNDGLEPVYVYFNQHGTLPAPMKFTLSLGREYQNDTLYWNYYNGERDRIDYYGNVRTNVKGTFSVMLTHMSTYMITEKRVIGSENKEGEPTSNSGGEISSYMDEPKTNPDTGGGGAR